MVEIFLNSIIIIIIIIIMYDSPVVQWKVILLFTVYLTMFLVMQII